CPRRLQDPSRCYRPAGLRAPWAARPRSCGPVPTYRTPAREWRSACGPGRGRQKGVTAMRAPHLPRPARPPWARPRQAWPRPGRKSLAVLATAALAAITLVSGTQHAAYAAADAPYGGTAAAVPGTVYAANYDTGGQGTAYNVTSANGSANSYRSDGVDLEATADTQNGTGSGADDIGWTTAGQWFNYTVNVATAGNYSVAFRVSSPYGITDALHVANSSGKNLSGVVAVPN